MPPRRPPVSGGGSTRRGAGPKAGPAAAAPRKAPSRLEPDALLSLARSGRPPAVVLVTGRDVFARDALAAGLLAALVTEGLEPFNYAALSGEEVAGDDLADRARVLPMGGGARLILVRRADRIRAGETEPLAAYAADPSPTTCLLLAFDAGRAPALEALKAGGVLVDLPAPRDYQLARWLEGTARGLGISLDAGAARALAERCGDDFVAAVSDLRVASLATKGKVTRASIEALGGRARDTNAFHLADALLSREPARAVRLLRDLHDEGQAGFLLLGMVEGQLRRLLRMRAKADAGLSPQAAVRSESPTLPPAALARIAGQVASFDEPRLIEAFRLARAADRSIKGGGSGGELAHMEWLAWRMAAL